MKILRSSIKRLKIVREELASIKQIQPRSITTDKILRQIAQRCPENEKELLAISGIGKQFVSHYGSQILKAVVDFKSNSNDKDQKSNKEMTLTDKVLKMIHDEKDIPDIASSLSISNGAVAKAIQEAIESGKKLEKSYFFLKSEYAKDI
jgi:ribonuclease D